MKTYTSEEQHRRMMETPLFRLLMSQSVPTVASQLVTTVYNMADTWFVSQISTSASAAVGVSFALMSIIQACGYGFGMGAGSLVSRRLGAKKDDEAAMYASSAFAGTILIGALIGLLGILFLEPLMRILGSTDTILPYSEAYSRYILLAAPVMCGSFVLNNVLRSEGESTFAMIGLCSGGLLNLILDPVLIFICGLGTAGAAIATAISQTVSFCVLLSAYIRKKSIVPLSLGAVSRRLEDYARILSTGFPTICRQSLGSISTAVLNGQAALYGDAAVAAITIVNKIYMLVRNIIMGIGQGFQPIAGYNFGAGNRKRTRRVFELACGAGTAVCLAAMILILVFRRPVMLWFRNDPEVADIGAATPVYSCSVMPFMAFSTYVNQLFQCIGFRVRATLLAACRQGIFFLPLAAVLPRFLGLQGVEMIQPGADLLTFAACIPFLAWFYSRILTEKSIPGKA